MRNSILHIELKKKFIRKYFSFYTCKLYQKALHT